MLKKNHESNTEIWGYVIYGDNNTGIILSYDDIEDGFSIIIGCDYRFYVDWWDQSLIPLKNRLLISWFQEGGLSFEIHI